MPSPPLPPYDVIIFFALWAIVAASWAVSAYCRIKDNCCGCARENAVCTILCGQAGGSTSSPSSTTNSETEQQMVSNNNNNTDALGGSGDAALRVLEQESKGYNSTSADPNKPSSSPNSSNNNTEPADAKTWIIRIISSIVLSFFIAFFLTAIIMAILGGVGFLDALLFSPAKSDTCSASCTFETRDGLSGWVNEECCTYSPVGLGTYYNTYLRFRDPSANNALSDYTIHGWMMYNSTKHFSAPADQKPLVLMYNHGSGNNIAAGYRIERYKFLLEQGNILILSYDYPSWGKSTGEAGVSSVLGSAKGVARYLETYLSSFTSATDLSALTYQQTSATTGITLGSTIPLGASLTDPLIVDLPANNGGVNISQVVMLGRSLGGAVTTYTATKSATDLPRAMVLQSTFSNLRELSAYYFPMFWWAFGASFSEYDDFNNVENIKNYKNKCLYHAHSKEDEWVPFAEAESIQEAANAVVTASCSQWVIVENAIHTQPLTVKERNTLSTYLRSDPVH